MTQEQTDRTVAEEIALEVVRSVCESDPADPEHPDTVCITVSDLELTVRCAVENWQELATAERVKVLEDALRWLPVEGAPKGCVTEDAGCRGDSEWFLGRPSGKYGQSAPFIVIKRRAWPQDDSWADPGDTYYLADYFDAWMPIPAALEQKGSDHG